MLLATGGGICAAIVANPSAAAGSPEERLRELLSDRRSLKLLRGDEQLEATYWTAAGGYNRDEYLSICWLLRDAQADRVFPMNHGLLDVLCGVQTLAGAHRHRRPAAHSLGISDTQDEPANRRCRAQLASYRRPGG